MKVASKVAVGSALLLLLAVGALGYLVAVVRDLVAVQREVSTTHTRAARHALFQIRLLDEIEESLRKLEVTHDPQYSAKVERLRREAGEGVAALATLGLEGAEGEALETFRQAWRALPAGTTDADEVRDVRERAEGLLAAVEAAIVHRARTAAAASETAGRVALGVAAAAVLLGLVVVQLTVRSINAPLQRLVAGTHTVAAGDFALELNGSSDDEFAQLEADFNAMVQRLGELDAMKKDLLSHVSHELKTPLATLQETHKILLEDVAGTLNDTQRRLLELNLRSSERLSRLISKLLDLSRMEAGAMAYELAFHDLRQLVRDALAELAPRARERSLRLDVELPAEPVEIHCDGDRLVQVVENLVENAIKFSPEGAAVRVGLEVVAAPPAGAPARWRGGGVLLAVRDAGPGVPVAERERIFDRFHQAGPRRGGSVGGAGLGLAICHGIVEAHRGAIWVADNEPAGSVFRVLLPPPADEGALSAADSARAGAPNLVSSAGFAGQNSA
ncbi:MAG TPA: HAMP domain-containing sensor histidine kinase [Thermoanaerobaculia bacterium]|jgi:two-component system sensor histidine kinase GlrK